MLQAMPKRGSRTGMSVASLGNMFAKSKEQRDFQQHAGLKLGEEGREW